MFIVLFWVIFVALWIFVVVALVRKFLWDRKCERVAKYLESGAEERAAMASAELQADVMLQEEKPAMEEVPVFTQEEMLDLADQLRDDQPAEVLTVVTHDEDTETHVKIVENAAGEALSVTEQSFLLPPKRDKYGKFITKKAARAIASRRRRAEERKRLQGGEQA